MKRDIFIIIFSLFLEFVHLLMIKFQKLLSWWLFLTSTLRKTFFHLSFQSIARLPEEVKNEKLAKAVLFIVLQNSSSH